MNASVDYIIVGTGIAGVSLGFELENAGAQVCYISHNENCSSMKAAAVLHPYHGQTGELIPELMNNFEAITSFYKSLGNYLKHKIIWPTSLISWEQGWQSQSNYDNPNVEVIDTLQSYWKLPLQQAVIKNTAYRIQTPTLFSQWIEMKKETKQWLVESYDPAALKHYHSSVNYKGITAKAIILCTGVNLPGVAISKDPRTQNKGEALILKIRGLPQEYMFHTMHRLVNIGEDKWWFGARHLWQFTSLEPDIAWQQTMCNVLAQQLKVPFELIDHVTGMRPTTQGQFPLLGRLPFQKNILLFTGLGSRGFSHAPVWAGQLAKHLIEEIALPGYPVQRFQSFFAEP